MAMREMKDSGIPWIGKIPKRWEIIKGKYILTYLQRPILSTDKVITCFRDGEVTLRSNRREEGFTISEKEIGYQGIDVGDLVVHGMDGFAGSIGISDSRGKASPVLNVLNSSQDKKFLMYYLRSMAYNNVFLALSTGIRVRSCDLNWNKLANLPYAIPPIQVQHRIADFLDAKCAKIDSIKKNVESEIEALKQYKQSVITEAVTKGLDKNVKMKDSGIPWIGKIPKDWEITRLKYLGNYRNGLTYSPINICSENDGVLVLRSSNVQNGKIDLKDNVYVNIPIRSDMMVRYEDILICSRNGSKTLIGKNAIIDSNINASFGAFMMIYRCIDSRYLYYILNSSVFSYYIGSFFTSTINQLTGTNFGNIKIPFCPEQDERLKIITYLDSKCAKIDSIIQKKQELLANLDTYKKSLIYEYVTGKKEVPAV